MLEMQPRSARKWCVGLLIVAFATAPVAALATELFNANLSFETRDQSMWGSGGAFIFDYKQEFLTPSIGTGSIFINPGPVTASGITVDPRFAFSAAGQMGVAPGFYINSGSVDANLDYGIGIGTASPVKSGEFFRLQGSSALLASSRLTSKSPTVETYLDGILRMSVNDYYEAKVSGGDFFNGIKNGTYTAQRDASHGGPRVNVDARKELFGFNSGGSGRLVWKGADIGGVGDVIKVGNPLAPAAVFTIGDWRIDAAGGVDAGALKAQGQTTLLTTLIDVDAAVVGPALGPSIAVNLGPNIHVDAGYDVVDFDTTLTTGYRQEFVLAPALSLTLHFSQDVLVKDAAGNVTRTDTVSAESLDTIPQIALLGGSVDVTPVFTVDADLNNKTDLSFNLLLQYKALAGHIKLDFDSLFYSNTIYNAGFGPLRTWDSNIDPLELGVYDQTFALGGFDSVAGTTFTVSAVPEPTSWLLVLAGLALVASRARGATLRRTLFAHREKAPRFSGPGSPRNAPAAPFL
ncbi:MAG: hypothetical protein IT530_13800 [Burkholderiales bacterium]|nr:hypothetical protein [Burkholderiales bacterium]